MAADGDEEDDYLSMSFAEPEPSKKETSLQRTARLKKEAAERGKVQSKKERERQAKEAREKALATELDASNKGAQMMTKMGFKGGALGKSEDARTQPIELLMKDDRGGIGMDSEKKRKIREAAEELEGQQKKQKVDFDAFRERNKHAEVDMRTEWQMWSAMRTLEGFDTGDLDGKEDGTSGSDEGGEQRQAAKQGPKSKPLRSANLLWRPLVKQRLERERDRRMRHDLDQSLSRNTAYDDPDVDDDDKLALGTEVEELDEEDPDLDDYESLTTAERLEKIVTELRVKYHYCFWCKFRYPEAGMEGCPGESEDEHG
ncbi:G-patch domain protein [Teratosphaeria destructans]|uniref:G-patch domain protein n=1 Tax=Teratosphaeria destructans TaxID=418781 RepID=A0A9W7W568_9PEZI|nr:G-patch domain protein [Teratosphaeria destructans]